MAAKKFWVTILIFMNTINYSMHPITHEYQSEL